LNLHPEYIAMAKGKKKGGRRQDDSDDDKPAPAAPAAGGKKGAKDDDEAEVAPTKSRKEKLEEKRMQKQKKAKQRDNDDDDDDDDDMAKLMSGGKIQNKYGGDSDDDDDDDDDDNVVAQVAAPSKKNKKKKGRAAAMAVLESSSDEEEEKIVEPDEDEDMMDDDDDDDGDVEQVAFKMMDDDDWGGDKKKKKKDKKEKKHKKDKKKKEGDDDGEEPEKSKKKKHSKKHKHHDEDDDGDDDEAEISQGVSDLKVEEKKEDKPKSKFELQMEAALKKKEAEEADKKAAAEPTTKAERKEKAKSAKALATQEPEPEWVDPTSKAPEEENNVVYGAPDDKAWTDKSHAIRDAENATEDDGHDLIYGPDGKKLSNKERKKVLKAKQAAEREAEFEATAAKNSMEGAQFACSQTAVNEKDPQWENAMDVKIPNFSISAAGKILFKDAALMIGGGRRYGLVGPNGRGKSTLLKMIASKDLKLPPRIDFLYVEQEVGADDTPAVEAVLRADAVRWNLMEEEKKLMSAIDAGEESEEVVSRLQVVVDELVNMGADSAEAKARRILYGLGFNMDMQTKPTKMFSGGWRMRISLARALFVEPTLLMLDEPTNHLDLNAVIWLDEYLQRWKKTLLVVSHDQDFLNSVCQEILHIEDLKLASYKGNYDSFKKAEKVKFDQHVKAYHKQEKRIRELKRGGQSRAKATESVKKNTKREAGARSQKKTNDAIAAGTETAVKAELIKRPREYEVKLEFSDVAELGHPVIEVNNVHFRYSPQHPVIFNCVDFGIDMDSRICIVGPNGAGKTLVVCIVCARVATQGFQSLTHCLS
jgi:ATP-binding cassette subfamily F protein 1